MGQRGIDYGKLLCHLFILCHYHFDINFELQLKYKRISLKSIIHKNVFCPLDHSNNKQFTTLLHLGTDFYGAFAIMVHTPLHSCLVLNCICHLHFLLNGAQELSGFSFHACVVSFRMVCTEHARREKLVRCDVLWEFATKRL